MLSISHYFSNTVLLSKRVHNYQCIVYVYVCMVIAKFSGETCMYSVPTWYPVRSMDGLSRSLAAG